MKFKSNKNKWFGFFAVAVVVIGILIWATHHARAKVAADNSDALPVAAVAKVTRENLFKAVSIPAEFRPFEEVELHAKVSGFLQSITVDFGDTVKAGQLLATLEVPELQDELANAQAAAQKAEVGFTNAHLIYSRLVSVNKDHPNLVAEQDLDTAQANDESATAAIAAANADMEKFQTMVSYTKITAPFDGIITRRYADPGALIQAGIASDTQSLPLVRLSDNYRLRLDFPVSVDYVKNIQLGDPVEVRVDSLDKTLSGKISRFAHDVDDQTRTMMTEIEVPNANLELVPGMYATVILKMDCRTNALAIPVEAVADEKNPTVLVLNDHDQIEERPVQLGLETPDKYEVISGLRAGELVVVGNRAQFQNGEKVAPHLLELSGRD